VTKRPIIAARHKTYHAEKRRKIGIGERRQTDKIGTPPIKVMTKRQENDRKTKRYK